MVNAMQSNLGKVYSVIRSPIQQRPRKQAGSAADVDVRYRAIGHGKMLFQDLQIATVAVMRSRIPLAANIPSCVLNHFGKSLSC